VGGPDSSWSLRLLLLSSIAVVATAVVLCVRVRRCVSCCVFVSLSRDVVVGVGGGEDEFLWPICGREKWQQQQLLSVPL
jgi:hypothetical protein